MTPRFAVKMRASQRDGLIALALVAIGIIMLMLFTPNFTTPALVLLVVVGAAVAAFVLFFAFFYIVVPLRGREVIIGRSK